VTAVISPGAGRRLSLPGRSAAELVSGAEGGFAVTVRRVTIPPEAELAPVRGPHRHQGCEEVMIILEGTGELVTSERTWPVGAGDVVIVSAGALHRTRNTGPGDLVSLCVFPVPDVAAVSAEMPEGSW